MVEHALRDCLWIYDYWLASSFVSYLTNDHIHVWVATLFKELDIEDCCLFITMLWVIWWGCNELLFKGHSFDHALIKHKAVNHREQFLKSTFQTNKYVGSRNVLENWRPPRNNWLKLNVDASVRRGEGATIVGVMRNCSGEILWCFAQRCDGVYEVEIAEALVLESGHVR
ncbi:hypothetical protein ACS0TY_008962 [Phlomoides rotata]